MSKRIAMIVIVFAVLVPAATVSAQRADAPSSPVVEVEPATLQALLKATREQWSVIFPKLQRIKALREEIHATPEASRARRGGQFDSPKGGTSMDAPTIPSGRGVKDPFDPKNAPGNKAIGLLGVLGLEAPLTRAVGRMLTPDNGNRVEHLLSDLQKLLASKETTDAQLREKLASIRAAKKRAAHDLAEAEGELVNLLTVDQIGHLVSLGYLE